MSQTATNVILGVGVIVSLGVAGALLLGVVGAKSSGKRAVRIKLVPGTPRAENRKRASPKRAAAPAEAAPPTPGVQGEDFEADSLDEKEES